MNLQQFISEVPIKKQSENGLYTVGEVRDVRPSVVYASNTIRAFPRCAEVGVQIGDHAVLMDTILKPSLLFLVDCWVDITNDFEEYNGIENYKYVCERFSKPYIIPLKGFSQSVLPMFPDDFFHFSYLDGGHDPYDIKSDIYNSIRITKIGGVIAGHDYESRIAAPSVKIVVNSVFNGMNLHTEANDWWIVVDEEVKNLIKENH